MFGLHHDLVSSNSKLQRKNENSASKRILLHQQMNAHYRKVQNAKPTIIMPKLQNRTSQNVKTADHDRKFKNIQLGRLFFEIDTFSDDPVVDRLVKFHLADTFGRSTLESGYGLNLNNFSKVKQSTEQEKLGARGLRCGDVLLTRKHKFTDEKPFSPRTIKSSATSKLRELRCYNPPVRTLKKRPTSSAAEYNAEKESSGTKEEQRPALGTKKQIEQTLINPDAKCPETTHVRYVNCEQENTENLHLRDPEMVDPKQSNRPDVGSLSNVDATQRFCESQIEPEYKIYLRPPINRENLQELSKEERQMLLNLLLNDLRTPIETGYEETVNPHKSNPIAMVTSSKKPTSNDRTENAYSPQPIHVSTLPPRAPSRETRPTSAASKKHSIVSMESKPTARRHLRDRSVQHDGGEFPVRSASDDLLFAQISRDTEETGKLQLPYLNNRLSDSWPQTNENYLKELPWLEDEEDTLNDQPSLANQSSSPVLASEIIERNLGNASDRFASLVAATYEDFSDAGYD